MKNAVSAGNGYVSYIRDMSLQRMGHAYPNGSYDDRIKKLLPGLGIHYARVAESTGNFVIPWDLYEWKPTCHHNERLLEKTEEFLALEGSQFWHLMYVWGHSYEFDREQNWELMEICCVMPAEARSI